MRPDKKSATYEYIPNKRYSYKDVKRTLAQVNIQVTASRYWSDLALSTLDDHQLHPYSLWCPGSTIDLYLMDAQGGLAHHPIGAEIIHRTDIPAPANGKPQKPRVDHRATVARLYHLGVMDGEGRETLLTLKAVIDGHIATATKERASVPFAVSHRVVQIFINRWTLVSKSLDFVANPYNPHVVRGFTTQKQSSKTVKGRPIWPASPCHHRQLLQKKRTSRWRSSHNQLHPAIRIAKTQRVAAATQSKNLGSTRKFLILHL